MIKEDATKTTVYSVTYKIIKRIETMDDSARKAILANLRKSISQPLTKNMDALSFVLKNIPDEFLGDSRKLGKEEKAILSTLQLYALFQQGINKNLCEELPAWDNIGYSLSYLREGEDNSPSDKRFNAMINTSDFDELLYHLRQLIKLLKSRNKTNVKINYPKLSQDLLFIELGVEDIKLSWAKSYYRFKKKDDK